MTMMNYSGILSNKNVCISSIISAMYGAGTLPIIETPQIHAKQQNSAKMHEANLLHDMGIKPFRF